MLKFFTILIPNVTAYEFENYKNPLIILGHSIFLSKDICTTEQMNCKEFLQWFDSIF